MEIVDALFSSKAIIFNAVYANGYKVPIYIDARRILSYPIERSVIISSMRESLIRDFPACEMVAGTCTAGIPYAAMLSHSLNLPMCYVRPEKKNKGLGNQIEGHFNRSGIKTIIVEDVVAHANSIVSTQDALKHVNASILGVLSIFSFEMIKAIEIMKTLNIKHVTLSSFDEVIHTAADRGYISKEDYEILHKYRDHTPREAWS